MLVTLALALIVPAASLQMPPDSCALPEVPAAPPDTLPEWVYHDSTMTRTHFKHLLYVGFKSDATPLQRRRALAAVCGQVIGGWPMPRPDRNSNGWYAVQVEDYSNRDRLDSLAEVLQRQPGVRSAGSDLVLYAGPALIEQDWRNGATRTRLPVESLYYSQVSGPDAPMREVARDSAQLQRWWARVMLGAAPPVAQPPVDFTRRMVVFAGLGSLPSGGYDITVDSSVVTDSEYLIYVRSTEPGENCVVTGVETSPVDVVRVARSELPTRFIERVEVVHCGG